MESKIEFYLVKLGGTKLLLKLNIDKVSEVIKKSNVKVLLTYAKRKT